MKRIMKLLFFITIIALLLGGCNSNESVATIGDSNQEHQKEQSEEMNQDDQQNAKENLNSEVDQEKAETIKAVPETVKDLEKDLTQETPVTKKVEPSSNTKVENNKPVKQVEKSITNQPTVTQTEKKSEVQSSGSSEIKESVKEQPTTTETPTTSINQVTMIIKADAETGVILNPTQVLFEKGDTVLDVLKKVTKEKRIQMEYQGSGPTAYIEGIQNLYEFDKGPKSGWMYNVNGTFKKMGAGTAEVKAGDRIEWVYTLDLGKDVGANK
ncbi:DUF4430 domain-containing protein [Bacillus sp. Marseille-P3661]|uniref:DUF4430 domain-containing protein n=1 Tax=Bacillus sp. Marseille-P3661 TaxID=1936234 RepID=UPI0021558CFA|nr:DUF4430 domain-containing protein [Bacillus sp. Marseille-P3661]